MKRSKYIDHTILKADATKEQIVKLCNEAKEYDFASVCINTCYVPLAKELLKDSDVNVCCVVGFPLGAMSSEAKAFEAKKAIEDGADEVDMVLNIGKLKDREYEYVTNDIALVKKACGDKVLKVILENCLLTDEEKVMGCKCSVSAHADFVKTSTGFSTSGATIDDVKLMKATVNGACKVKAAGGVRTKEDFDAMIEAGADRIGTSSGIKLI